MKVSRRIVSGGLGIISYVTSFRGMSVFSYPEESIKKLLPEGYSPKGNNFLMLPKG